MMTCKALWVVGSQEKCSTSPFTNKDFGHAAAAFFNFKPPKNHRHLHLDFLEAQEEEDLQMAKEDVLYVL